MPQANPQRLFAAQRIKVRGNVDTALRVAQIITHERAKVNAIAAGERPTKSKRTGGRFFSGVRSKL